MVIYQSRSINFLGCQYILLCLHQLAIQIMILEYGLFMHIQLQILLILVLIKFVSYLIQLKEVFRNLILKHHECTYLFVAVSSKIIKKIYFSLNLYKILCSLDYQIKIFRLKFCFQSGFRIHPIMFPQCYFCTSNHRLLKMLLYLQESN